MFTNILLLIISNYVFLGCSGQKVNKKIIKKNPDNELNLHYANISELEKLQEKGSEFVLMIYADWCYHCRNTKPTFIKASEYSKIPFILLNAEQEGSRDFLKKEEVEGFPTIRKYKGKNKTKDYYGNRTVNSFIDFSSK